MISRMSIMGTGYHEAFHKIFRTCLSDKEKEDMYNEIYEKHGVQCKADAEEILADAFADYMVDRTYHSGLSGMIIRFFKTLWNMIFDRKKILRVSTEIFNRINNEEYASTEFEYETMAQTRKKFMMSFGMTEELADWAESQRNSFENLDSDTRQALIEAGVDARTFNILSSDLREGLLDCI